MSPVTTKAVILTNFPFQRLETNCGAANINITWVSRANRRQLECLVISLFRPTAKKIKLILLTRVWGIHRWPVDPPHKGAAIRKDCPCHDDSPTSHPGDDRKRRWQNHPFGVEFGKVVWNELDIISVKFLSRDLKRNIRNDSDADGFISGCTVVTTSGNSSDKYFMEKNRFDILRNFDHCLPWKLLS